MWELPLNLGQKYLKKKKQKHIIFLRLMRFSFCCSKIFVFWIEYRISINSCKQLHSNPFVSQPTSARMDLQNMRKMLTLFLLSFTNSTYGLLFFTSYSQVIFIPFSPFPWFQQDRHVTLASIFISFLQKL